MWWSRGACLIQPGSKEERSGREKSYGKEEEEERKEDCADYKEDNDYDEGRSQDPAFHFKIMLSMTFSLTRPHHLRSSSSPLNPLSCELINGLIHP